MRMDVDGDAVYASTGGREHADGRPWIVLVHGAGASHLIWMLQSRALAYDGYNVLAPDLPGHNLSGGNAIAGVDGQAEWLLKAMSAAGCEKTVMIAHSMGGLIAIEAASSAPERIEGIVFVASAAAIPVNPRLIESAEKDEEAAFAAMMAWAHGPDAHVHDHTWPGGSHLYFGIDMMRLNRPGTLATDLKTCAGYRDGIAHARNLACPSLCILARLDKMTPVENGMKLAEALRDSETVIAGDCGHTIPTERPTVVNSAIRRFLAGRIRSAGDRRRAASRL